MGWIMNVWVSVMIGFGMVVENNIDCWLVGICCRICLILGRKFRLSILLVLLSINMDSLFSCRWFCWYRLSS